MSKNDYSVTVGDWFYSEKDGSYYHFCPKCKTYKKCVSITDIEESRHYLECKHSVVVSILTGNTVKEK